MKLALTAAAVLIMTGPALGSEGAEDRIRAACGWLSFTLETQPERDDVFAFYMRAMRPKCQAAIEAIERRDRSVSAETITALAEEIEELRAVVEAEDKSPRPPPQSTRTPTPEPAPKPEPRPEPRPEPTPRPEPSPAPSPAPTPSSERTAVPPATSVEVSRTSSEEAPSAAGEGAGASRSAGRGLTGTWVQEPRQVLDRHEKRTLNLHQTEDGVEGELYEEVWMDAPMSWVDRSCGGNTTFRMVTTARISGGVNGRDLTIRRDIPRLLACTCPSRCNVEQRRRGLKLSVSPSGHQLSDSTGVFVREGAGGGGLDAAGAAPAELTFAGAWESRPARERNREVVVALELTEDDGVVSGTLFERVDQPLPLQSWSERFCDGADRWQHVTSFEVEGRRSGDRVTLSLRSPRALSCTCPSKCIEPQRRRPMTFDLTPDGRGLMHGNTALERR